jgi:hypothetical protein
MSEKKNDQVDINVQAMQQHVYQHPGEPRDFDYRVQAFAFALSITKGEETDYTINEASLIEKYLRNGA